MMMMSQSLTRRRFLARSGVAALGLAALPEVNGAQSEQTTAGRMPVKPASFADLQRFIPEMMSHAGVPGLSIAVIRDAKIAWRQAFGVKNKETGEAMTNDTPMAAASFSKA